MGTWKTKTWVGVLVGVVWLAASCGDGFEIRFVLKEEEASKSTALGDKKKSGTSLKELASLCMRRGGTWSNSEVICTRKVTVYAEELGGKSCADLGEHYYESDGVCYKTEQVVLEPDPNATTFTAELAYAENVFTATVTNAPEGVVAPTDAVTVTVSSAKAGAETSFNVTVGYTEGSLTLTLDDANKGKLDGTFPDAATDAYNLSFPNYTTPLSGDALQYLLDQYDSTKTGYGTADKAAFTTWLKGYLDTLVPSGT